MGIVKANGRMFELDSKPFIPIGHVEEAKAYLPKKADAFFKKMSEIGENVCRIPTDNVQYGPTLEADSIGDFTGAYEYMAPIVEAADKYGIWLIFEMYMVNSFLWKPWWIFKGHPYGSYRGGPCNSYDEFFGEEAKNLLKERIIWLTETFPGKPVFSWELFHELNHEKNEWVEEMAAFVKAHTDVMLSISTMHPAIGDATWAHYYCQDFDYISIEGYGQDMLFYPWISGNGQEVLDTRAAAPGPMIQMTRDKMTNTERPILDIETPYTPSFWEKAFSVFLKNIRKLPQADVDRNFYDVADRYMQVGAAGTGLSWTVNRFGLFSLSKAQIKYQTMLAEKYL